MPYDVAVLGCGPAGVVTAMRLKAMGYHVVLLGRPRKHATYEGLSPRVIEGLRRAGLSCTLEVCSIPADRTANWNGTVTSINQEYLVDRSLYDQALLRDAALTGVTVLTGQIRKYVRAHDLWQIALDAGSLITTKFLVEARGRRAPNAGALAARGPKSISLSRHYHGVQDQPANTYMCSFKDGWCWYASPGDKTAMIQLMLSGSAVSAANKAGLESLFEKALNNLDIVKQRLGKKAQPQSSVFARDSTPCMSSAIVTPNSIRVGDAAFAIDPLSGHGNFEAVGGALAAAAVINTLISRAGDHKLASTFYNERNTNAFLRHARTGRDFYRQEQKWPDRDFWQERLNWPDDIPSHLPVNIHAPKIEKVPVLEDDFIVEREVIVTADQPRGIRMVAGVPIVDLMKVIRGKSPDAEKLARKFNVDVTGIKTALAWLSYRGLISPQDNLRSAP